jgi:hypothetical protein
MGASGWSYFVPYEDDIQLALNKLRDAVFRNDDYPVRPAFQAGDMTFDDFLPPDATEEEREEYREQYEDWQSEVQPGSFASIDELLAWNGEEGTHSILDVQTLMPTPLEHPTIEAWERAADRKLDMQGMIEMLNERLGKVYPLSQKQLLTVFETVQPSHEMVARSYVQLQDLRDRGVGLYVIVYKDNLPTEIFFTGYSGD